MCVTSVGIDKQWERKLIIKITLIPQIECGQTYIMWWMKILAGWGKWN